MSTDLYATAFVLEHTTRALQSRGQFLDHFDSPLEVSFDIWWQLCGDQFGDAAIASQVTIDCGDEQFRVDFVACRRTGHPIPLSPSNCVIVELDGHEFHERTKSQVARRNHRDRVLASAGWRILHFSGSEFHRNPLVVLDAVQRAVRALPPIED